MRSLSNIIKSGRVRSQTILDLSEHYLIQERLYSEELIEQEEEKEDTKAYDQKVQEQEIYLQQQLLRAKAEVQKMREVAQNEVAQMLQEARQKANHTLAEAKEQGTKIKSAAEGEAKQIKLKAQEEKVNILGMIEGEVVETIKILLEHIISEEMSYRTDWLYYLVKKMLKESYDGEEIKLTISSQLYDHLSIHEIDKIEHLRDKVTICASESLPRGKCQIDTSQGGLVYDVTEGLQKVLSDVEIMESISRRKNG